ncbi:MAG: ERAP1-like C-terminal domain-containing protein, partial [Candidatus Eremiobacteraeota bacterium]|nr:ERAP1-like C-terminal domain-containing protein [Candidatus Eremiobacteraeota bacterium]
TGEHIRVPEVRNELIRLMGVELQDEATTKKAQEVADRYLAGEKVNPDTADTYLGVAAFYGEPELVERVKVALVKAQDPQRRSTLLNTLGLFAQPEAHAAALQLLLDEAVTPSDLRYLVSLNGRVREARTQRLQAWLEENYGALRARMPDAFVAYIPLSLSGARDQEQLEKIVAFFSQQDDPNGAIQRALAKLQETVRDTIAARRRGQQSFHAYLRTSSK